MDSAYAGDLPLAPANHKPMLEKPDLAEERISACLQKKFGLLLAQISFLPIGADLHTAVYRAVTTDGTAYFVKLRRGAFAETSVTLPKFLSNQGIAQIIAPLTSKTGGLWAELDPFKVILYPFIPGRDGYEVNLSDGQWREFGGALRRIHDAVLPSSLTNGIRPEAYSSRWRDSVRSFLTQIADNVFDDPVAKEVAAFLQSKREVVFDLVARAERLAQALKGNSPEFIVCHSDLHAGNIHTTLDGALYIVDWDAPILAPKERDLMVAGSGLMGGWHAPAKEEALFYEGYGPTAIDQAALAYYRYERIIEDIAIYCAELLLGNEGGDDRIQSLRYLKSNFLPNHTIEVAYKSDKSLYI